MLLIWLELHQRECGFNFRHESISKLEVNESKKYVSAAYTDDTPFQIICVRRHTTKLERIKSIYLQTCTFTFT